MQASSILSLLARAPLLVVVGMAWLLAAGVCRADGPVIAVGPQPVAVAPGQSAVLGVTATGVPPLSHQWHRNGFPVAGATGASHTISSVDEATTGVWSVKVTDGDGHSAFAFCRVASPGALIAWSSGTLRSVASVAAQVPVAFCTGDPTFAIGSTGEVLLVGDDVALAAGTPFESIGPVVDMAANGARVVVLMSDGMVRAWERGYAVDYPHAPVYTEITLPPDATRGKAIAAGPTAVLVVRWDGTVAVVAPAGNPLVTVPAGLNDAVAVAAAAPLWMPPEGAGQGLALRADGTVSAWGTLENGQTNVPAGLTDVAHIAGGGGFALAMKADGIVVQWKAPFPSLPGGTLTPSPPPAQIPVTSAPLGSNSSALATSSAASSSAIVLISEPPGFPPAEPCRLIRANSYLAYAVKISGEPESWKPAELLGVGAYLKPIPPQVGDIIDIAGTNGEVKAICRAKAPLIEVQPESVAVHAGGTAWFSVQAAARPEPGYQWARDGTPIAGATRAELRIMDVQSANTGSYTVTVTNIHGSVTSGPSVLSLASGPTISQQPENLALHPGQGGSLSVTASGSGTLGYQWFRNGRALGGETASSLTIASGSPDAAGVYQVVITDALGTRRSNLVRVGEGCTAVGWRDGTTVTMTGFSWQTDVLLGISEGEAWLGVGANGNLSWLYASPSGDGWGFDPFPLSFPAAGHYYPPEPTPKFVASAARGKIGMAVADDHTVLVWQSQTWFTCIVPTVVGYTGTGSCYPSPGYRMLSVPAAARSAIAVSVATNEEALALRGDGRVIGWDARWGVLKPVPSAVAAGVAAISSGADHHLALKQDGSVIAWGDNAQGESTVPAGLAGIKAIAALDHASFAIHADGSVTAWGANDHNQMAVPAGLTNVASISGAKGTVIATKIDGSIVTWGDGSGVIVPGSITSVRSAGVLPASPSSYALALAPVGPPVTQLYTTVKRVFPGWSGEVTRGFIESYPAAPLTGAWQKAGVPLAAPQPVAYRSTALVLNNVTTADAGVYRFAASNGWQTGLSGEVTLEVVQPRVFSGWQTANFTPAEIAAGLAAPGADPGGFGITNLMRYTLGLDARNPQAAGVPGVSFTPAQTGSTWMTASTITLSFEVPQDTADVGIFLESSPDLITWTRTGTWLQTGTLQNGRRQASFMAPGPGSVPISGNLGGIPIGGSPAPATTTRWFYRIAIEPATPSLAPSF